MIIIGPISLAWRLGGDSSLRWLRRRLPPPPPPPHPRRLLETSRVSGESREIQTCSIFFFFFFFFWGGGETFSVSSRSRRRLRDVRAQSHVLVSRVAATSPWWERKPFFLSPESPELPQLISRGSRGDVSASEIGPYVHYVHEYCSKLRIQYPLLIYSW